ncbi:MAG: hypothetical protein U0237_08605 [Thermoleophilia bacterium]
MSPLGRLMDLFEMDWDDDRANRRREARRTDDDWDQVDRFDEDRDVDDGWNRPRRRRREGLLDGLLD